MCRAYGLSLHRLVLGDGMLVSFSELGSRWLVLHSSSDTGFKILSTSTATRPSVCHLNNILGILRYVNMCLLF